MASESHGKEDELFIAPASASQARAEAVLPSQGSEDVSHLLRQFPRKQLPERSVDEDREYLPNSKVDWVVHVDFPPTVVLRKSDIGKVLDAGWRKRNDLPTIFGFDPQTKKWTFVNAGDSPETYSRLQIAWKMRSFDKHEPISKKQFEQYRMAVEKAAPKLKATGVRVELPTNEAHLRSAKLLDLIASCDRSISVILQASQGRRFDGKAIWDVMLCLGLQWGDMDLFHWENPGIPGDDHLFSVWTSTPPGFFFPEEIAAGRVRTDDLVFGFSIARTFEPGSVFDSMMRAIQYTQKRLGGVLVDAEGGGFFERSARSEIVEVEKTLRDAGFEPGSGDTLYLI